MDFTTQPGQKPPARTPRTEIIPAAAKDGSVTAARLSERLQKTTEGAPAFDQISAHPNTAEFQNGATMRLKIK